MIGENILTARKHAGLTQEALAEAVGVSRQTIAKWEAGESTPDLAMAGALAKALEISLDDLVQIGLPPVGPGMRGKHMFGLVTVGDKGQIVIPVQARRMFDLQPGTQLMVLGDESQGLALVNANFFLEALEVMRHDGK
ncbi:MAG: helix-turn-helix domain-containing protein [Clostridia bacterium]|nr:helix-turn-helix domain-containing protein [Clostridia bacterium]